MLRRPAAKFSTSIPVSNPSRIAQIFRGLPEFARGEVQVNAEEFHWMVSQYHHGKPVTQPVATVRLTNDNNLQIECGNEYTMRAMRILLDCLVGTQFNRRPNEPLHMQSDASQT